jgi:hypothetical protein
MGGWFNGACQMIGTAEFGSLDAFRAYLKQTSLGTVLYDDSGLRFHVSLPIQPPNPTTYITIRFKLLGAEPITANSQRGSDDRDTWIWTFTKLI